MGISLLTAADWRRAAQEMLDQASRRVRLREDALSDQNWNNAQLAAALKNFLLAGPQRRAEFLLSDTRHLYARCPALLDLLARFGHLIEIRLQEEEPAPECYFLADDKGLLLRPSADNWNARYAPRDRRAAAPWQLHFEAAWERAGAGIPARPLGL